MEQSKKLLDQACPELAEGCVMFCASSIA